MCCSPASRSAIGDGLEKRCIGEREEERESVLSRGRESERAKERRGERARSSGRATERQSDRGSEGKYINSYVHGRKRANKRVKERDKGWETDRGIEREMVRYSDVPMSISKFKQIATTHTHTYINTH